MNVMSRPTIVVRCADMSDAEAMVELDRLHGENLYTNKELKRLLTDSQEIACMVAVATVGRRKTVVGFLMYEIHGRKFDVMALVAKDQEYEQIASPLLEEFFRSMVRMNRRAVFYVRESDLARQVFLRKHRFRCRRIVRGWFQEYDPGENRTVLEDGYRFYLNRRTA